MISKKSSELWFRKKLQMQGAQNLRSEACFLVRCTTKVKRNAADGLFTKPSSFPICVLSEP